MRFYSKETARLRKSRNLADSRFPGFGINKKQETVRLIYEISKREDIQPEKVISTKGVPLGNVPNCFDYEVIKRYLLRRRYPYSFASLGAVKGYLPKIGLDPGEYVSKKTYQLYPNYFFIESKIKNSSLARNCRKIFPRSNFTEIKSLKEYCCQHRGFSIKDYNTRRDRFFIVDENYDFFKPCPCSRGAANCGYHIFNLGFGCVYECAYCFLQGYANAPGIILPANINRFFDKFDIYKKKGMRIGTGEFSDSLALDHLTEYSLPIIDFFRGHKGVTFEFKTKSRAIANILKARHAGNIVISWSLNPRDVIKENEFFTASLGQRLEAAGKCVRAGYKIGVHLDPVIYFAGWEEEYRQLIDELFSRIKPRDIAWISLGTFRFIPSLKQVIERRFPDNSILDQELIPGFDGKLRYPFSLRLAIYDKLLNILRARSRRLKLYICMEEPAIWQKLGK